MLCSVRAWRVSCVVAPQLAHGYVGCSHQAEVHIGFLLGVKNRFATPLNWVWSCLSWVEAST